MKRPKGISIIAFFLILIGIAIIASVPGYLISLIGIFSRSPIYGEVSERYNTFSLVLSSIVLFLGGPICLVGALGLLYLKEGARRLVIYFAVFSLVLNCIALFIEGKDVSGLQIVATVITLFLSIFILLYLSRETIKQYFV